MVRSRSNSFLENQHLENDLETPSVEFHLFFPVDQCLLWYSVRTLLCFALTNCGSDCWHFCSFRLVDPQKSSASQTASSAKACPPRLQSSVARSRRRGPCPSARTLREPATDTRTGTRWEKREGTRDRWLDWANIRFNPNPNPTKIGSEMGGIHLPQNGFDWSIGSEMGGIHECHE